jgi:hypothetical protein
VLSTVIRSPVSAARAAANRVDHVVLAARATVSLVGPVTSSTGELDRTPRFAADQVATLDATAA